ncbi:ankyrin repeat domain-containing protein [Nocardiopsis sp. FIRDI 009]|uniref:ankyrin repeat domain-containing protein n=1 Tax=Nocardiopsis sp. FIRDI 009 TaxID=714197 RepID=UPI000E26E454|nr:ankyrin repeat domain-containing protein [Nocardiopsis sp. FIRDI 009]
MNAVSARARRLARERERIAWLRAIRRYAVPGWMIERATERRLAGDWRGACAAAGVDVAFDLAGVANEHGSAFAAALADDLRHLAPDLLRWHLPRIARSRTTLVPDQTVVLSARGTAEEAPRLVVGTPSWAVHGAQRLTLTLDDATAPHSGRFTTALNTDWPYAVFWRNVEHPWTAARHLWDVRYAAELGERLGGDGRRVPFLNPDGTPRPAADLPSADPGRDDPAAFTEWVTRTYERGDVLAALAAVGVAVDTAPVTQEWLQGEVDPVEELRRLPLDPVRLGAEARRLAAAGHGDRFWIPNGVRTVIRVDLDGPDRARLRVAPHDLQPPGDAVLLPEVCWQRSPDIDLLRDGRTPLDELHPLVRGALAPAAPAPTGPVGPPEPTPPAPVRIRCQGAWHEVAFTGGELRLPHTREEEDREAALQALGGRGAGCFAAREAWRTGRGRLPRALRAQRRDLLRRIQHGDVPGVLRLLDAGVDPCVCDRLGRTPLHLLYRIDHEDLLPRLLAAGLDIEALDEEERTPLFTAIAEHGSERLVRDLVEAGARVDVIGMVNGAEFTLPMLVDWRERRELSWLADRIVADHPDLEEL